MMIRSSDATAPGANGSQSRPDWRDHLYNGQPVLLGGSCISSRVGFTRIIKAPATQFENAGAREREPGDKEFSWRNTEKKDSVFFVPALIRRALRTVARQRCFRL
jgi:hypothetical protein